MVNGSDLEEQIDNALREVLGYVPADQEDLSTAIDSMQKLELLIALEENLSIPFDDEALGAEWWASRKGIVTYANEARRLSA
jgi:acyl carrier protein